MNFRRLTAAASFVAALSIPSVVTAQQARPAAGGGAAPAAQQPARPAAATTQSPAAPTGTGEKFAVINTQAFGAPQGGITKVVNAMASVDKEFTPRRTELQNMQNQMTALTTDINKKAPLSQPAALAADQEKLDGMKREFERKQQDAEIAYRKRMNEVLQPVYEDVGKSLEAFASQRGIGAVLDISKTEGLFLTNAQLDITAAFIADYNSRNPATASAAAPGR